MKGPGLAIPGTVMQAASQAAAAPLRMDLALRPSLRVDMGGSMLPSAPMGKATVFGPAVPAPAAPHVLGPRVLRDFTIRDGLHIGADGVLIALAGIEPPPSGSNCRRLDGVVETCAIRASNRLEVLTRGRPVVCDLTEGAPGDLRGVCRAGKIDLADDLVRNGLAVRTSEKL